MDSHMDLNSKHHPYGERISIHFEAKSKSLINTLFFSNVVSSKKLLAINYATWTWLASTNATHMEREF